MLNRTLKNAAAGGHMGASTAVDKSLELKIFIFLTVFLAPLLAILLVSGIGFAVWFSQMLIGPPGVS